MFDLAVQHQLGGYRQFRAPAPVASFCECVWWYKAPRDTCGSVHRVLPDPSVNIQFTYVRDAQGRVSEPELVVWGPSPTPQMAAYEPGREIVALKVKLEWGKAVGELRVDRLAERLGEAPSMRHATDVLVATVAAQVRGRTGVAGHALDLVRWSQGRCGVERIADRLGVSARYLRRAVERESGETLKRYARVVRLLRAITVADAHPAMSWAALAADTGFYDQSHLIRECQALCGLTPREILLERRAEITVDLDAR